MTTEYKTYPTARFHICDGFYTLEEIEDFVVQFRAAKQVQDRALKRSMDLTQENFEKVVAEMSASGEQVALRPTWATYRFATDALDKDYPPKETS